MDDHTPLPSIQEQVLSATLGEACKVIAAFGDGQHSADEWRERLLRFGMRVAGGGEGLSQAQLAVMAAVAPVEGVAVTGPPLATPVGPEHAQPLDITPEERAALPKLDPNAPAFPGGVIPGGQVVAGRGVGPEDTPNTFATSTTVFTPAPDLGPEDFIARDAEQEARKFNEMQTRQAGTLKDAVLRDNTLRPLDLGMTITVMGDLSNYVAPEDQFAIAGFMPVPVDMEISAIQRAIGMTPDEGTVAYELYVIKKPGDKPEELGPTVQGLPCLGHPVFNTHTLAEAWRLKAGWLLVVRVTNAPPEAVDLVVRPIGRLL